MLSIGKRTEAFARNTLEAVQTPELHGRSAGKWVLREYTKPSLPPPPFGTCAPS